MESSDNRTNWNDYLNAFIQTAPITELVLYAEGREALIRQTEWTIDESE